MVCISYLAEGTWFGYNYYTPEVLVAIKDVNGEYRQFIMEADSGAAVSLLPRSAADVLGIAWDSGQPITLAGVGGATFTCYVHKLDIAVIDEEMVQIPLAFAPTDDFPPLLGRIGIYDQKTITMDNDQKATCVGAIGEPLPAPGSPSYVDMYGVPLELIALVGAGLLLVLVLRR